MINRYLIAILLIVLLLFSLWYFGKALFHKVPLPDISEISKGTVVESPEDKVVGNEIDYTGIVEKNIFHPDRKYIEASSETGVGEENMPPAIMPVLAVKGIVRGPDGEYIAYISQDGKSPQAVHIGDRIENLKVVSISRTDVTIRWNNAEVKLSLKKVQSLEKKR